MYRFHKAKPTSSPQQRSKETDYLKNFLYVIRCGMIESAASRRLVSPDIPFCDH
jgi:hypothetical protein